MNKLIGSFFILVLWISSGYAQGKYFPMKDPGNFRHNLSDVTKNTSSLESDFIQEKNLSVLSEKITTKGKFYFKREKNLRWEYTDPFNYLIIIKNDKVFIKDENKESRFDAESNKVFTEVNAIMVGSIRGTILEDTKRFRFTYMQNNETNLVILSPLSTQLKQYIREIRIFFNKTDYSVIRLDMQESSGDNTKIEFTGMKINKPIPDERFSIK